MARSDTRGQSSLELALIMLALTTFIFTMYSIAEQTQAYFQRARLSQEIRK